MIKLSLFASLLCIIFGFGGPSDGHLPRIERVLVWASDDEDPQSYRYEIRVNGRVVEIEHVSVEVVD